MRIGRKAYLLPTDWFEFALSVEMRIPRVPLCGMRPMLPVQLS